MKNEQLIAVIAGKRAASALAKKYNTLMDLARADEGVMGQIPGVGASAARKIKAALALAVNLNQEAGIPSPDFGNDDDSAAQEKLVTADQIAHLRTPRKFPE